MIRMELKRTNELFTYGIVNLPVVKIDGVIQRTVDKKTGRWKPITDSSSRFLFFELDDHLDSESFNTVQKVYSDNHLPVFIHRTMRGFHFISVKPIPKELHSLLLGKIKHLNVKCPHVTLRIQANKWIGEKQVWSDGAILAEEFDKDLANLREWMIREKFWKIKANYRVVKYRQEGIKGDL